MSDKIEVVRNDETLWSEGIVCDGTRCIFHYRQAALPGECYYLIDLGSTCECGRKFRDHEVFGIGVGVVE